MAGLGIRKCPFQTVPDLNPGNPLCWTHQEQEAVVQISLLGVLTWLVLAAVYPLLAAAAPTIPQPSSQFYVLDQANVLDASTEQTIVQTSAALQQKTKAQIVVVTINSLNGAAPEEFALAILRGWGIGDKSLNNGLLLLVCPAERVSRIEVGYGLEGALPDA
ncbi:MAG: TPM domain-containing protein, partial [Desulfotomaculaceae bacterium]|nr:TPM domain-containing protein [Desulfotomaculaceae bacterium]